MPKANNLMRRKVLRTTRTTKSWLSVQDSPLAPSSLLGGPRTVSNEDMHESSPPFYPVVSPLSSQTKFNEDGTYRMEVAIPQEQRQDRQSRLLRRSSTSSTASTTSSSTCGLKRSTGSLKRCLLDLTELVTESSSREDRFQILQTASSADSCNSGDNWGHFIDEIPLDDHKQSSFVHLVPYPKRRRLIKSRHDKPLTGFFLASVDETAKELDNLRF